MPNRFPCIVPQVVGVHPHVALGHSVLAQERQLLSIPVHVAAELELEVRKAHSPVLAHDGIKGLSVAVPHDCRVAKRAPQRRDTRELLDGLRTLPSEQVEVRELDGAPRRRVCVHDALALVEPPRHIVQCLEVPLPRTPVRRQEALRSLDAFPRDVLARTAFADAGHSVPIDLDPNGLCLRTLRRAMLEPLPEGYDDAVKGQ